MEIFLVIVLGIFCSNTVFCEEEDCEKKQVCRRLMIVINAVVIIFVQVLDWNDKWSVVAVGEDKPYFLYCHEYFFYKNRQNETIASLTEYQPNQMSNQIFKSISRSVIIALQNCTFENIREDIISALCPSTFDYLQTEIVESLNEEDGVDKQMEILDTDMNDWFVIQEWIFYNRNSGSILSRLLT